MPNLAVPTSRICILKHLLINMSTWKFHCIWFPKISAYTTNYAKKPAMIMSGWNSGRVCTTSQKLASLPTSSSNSVLYAMDTSNSPTHLASGNMFHNPSGSLCAWTTLASNTLVTNTSSTSLLLFGQRNTILLKIGRAISIVVSLLHGTMTKDVLT